MKKKIRNNKFNTKNDTSYTRSGADTVGRVSAPAEQYYINHYYLFLKTLKRDYSRLGLIFNSHIVAEQERERRNKEEILHLNKLCNQMQNELINIKRTNWCRYCESEATYISSNGHKFFCSIQCEQKQIEFVSVIDNIYNGN